MEEKEFYTVKELAKKFGVVELTIRKFLESGDISYYQIGRQKRIAPKDIENYLKQQRRERKQKKA